MAQQGKAPVVNPDDLTEFYVWNPHGERELSPQRSFSLISM